MLQLKIKAKAEFAKIVASNNELKYELEMARKEKIENEPIQDNLDKKVEERVAEMKRTLSSYRLERKREIKSLTEETSRAKKQCDTLKKENQMHMTTNHKLQKSNATLRKKLKKMEENLFDKNERIESLSNEMQRLAEEKDQIRRRQHRMSQEEIARLEASENAVVHLKKKHLNSKNEAVKIAMRYEDIKEQNFRFVKSLKFMLIPRARDIASMIQRLQATSRDAIESRKSNVNTDSKFTLEISTTDDDDEVEMELSRICNSKSTKGNSCEVLGRFMQRTIEDIETLSDNINKLIDSQKEEAGGDGYDTAKSSQSENCCSALIQMFTGGGVSSNRKSNRRSYEIVENNMS